MDFQKSHSGCRWINTCGGGKSRSREISEGVLSVVEVGYGGDLGWDHCGVGGFKVEKSGLDKNQGVQKSC